MWRGVSVDRGGGNRALVGGDIAEGSEMIRYYPVVDGRVEVGQAVRVERRLQARWRRTRKVAVMGRWNWAPGAEIARDAIGPRMGGDRPMVMG